LLLVQQLSRRNSASTPQLLRITGFMIFNQKAYCSKSSVHFVVKVGINATQYKVMKSREKKKRKSSKASNAVAKKTNVKEYMKQIASTFVK